MTLAVSLPAMAYIPACDIHNGMHIWYLEYADSDYTMSHPRGVREGVVDIHEGPWHAKCANDGRGGPMTRIYVPFVPVRAKTKDDFDTRYTSDVWRTHVEAEAAYRRLR